MRSRSKVGWPTGAEGVRHCVKVEWNMEDDVDQQRLFAEMHDMSCFVGDGCMDA